MLIVAGFVVTDVIMLIVVTSIESARYSLKSIHDKEHPGLYTRKVSSQQCVIPLISFAQLMLIPR